MLLDLPIAHHEDVHAELTLVCSSCGKKLMIEDIGKKWDKCEFCGDPICVTCCHYMGTTIRGIWKYYIDIRRVCEKCRIKL